MTRDGGVHGGRVRSRAATGSLAEGAGVPGLSVGPSAAVPAHRRALAVGIVVLVLALGGVASSSYHHSGAGRPSSDSVAVAPSVALDSASSTGWYCPGPLPVGTPGEAASIAVTNLGRRAVRGTLTLVSSASSVTTVGGTGSSTTSTTSLDVAAGGESVVGLRRSGRRGVAAATVVVDGSGVAVDELVHGVHGISASPCSDHLASVSYLAAGSTSGADNFSLAVFDPGATPAVVDVSFAVGSIVVAPPAFQGLTIGAGQLQVLDVGHYLPSRPVVATSVTSTGGRVVAGTLVTAVVGHELLSSLLTGVSSSARSWLLPAGPAGGRSASVFSILDPSSWPATVRLRVGTSSAVSTDLSATVPAHGVVTLAPGIATSRLTMRWASVDSSGAGVVVARESFVLAEGPRGTARARLHLRRRALARRMRAAARAPVRSTSTSTSTSAAPRPATTVAPLAAVSALPTDITGVAVTSGVAMPSRDWVLPGGESDANTSEDVVVDNVSSRSATVQVEQLDGLTGSTATPFATMPPLVVRPGGILTVDMAAVTGADGTLPLVVTANRRVVVGEMLYARKTAGFTLPLAIGVR